MTNPSPSAIKSKATKKRKSLLMTEFLRTYERLTGERITTILIHSPEWVQMQNEFIKIFMPLLERKNECQK